MSLWSILFSVASNEDWSDVIAVVTNPGADDEAPYDFTGSTFDMQLRASPPVLKILLRLNPENGYLKAVDGNLVISVDRDTLAAACPPSLYYYDIVWTQPDGRRINFIQGTVTVTLGVSRDDN